MRSAQISRKGRKPDAAPKRSEVSYTIHPQASPMHETFEAIRQVIEDLPPKDNERGAVEKMLQANAILRNARCPPPFEETTHRLQLGDARQLDWRAAESVPLVVTSPPYWTLKQYEPGNDS